MDPSFSCSFVRLSIHPYAYLYVYLPICCPSVPICLFSSPSLSICSPFILCLPRPFLYFYPRSYVFLPLACSTPFFCSSDPRSCLCAFAYDGNCLSVCAYMCMWVFACTCVCGCACGCLLVHVCVGVRVGVCLYMCVWVCVWVLACTCVCVRIWVWVCGVSLSHSPRAALSATISYQGPFPHPSPPSRASTLCEDVNIMLLLLSHSNCVHFHTPKLQLPTYSLLLLSEDLIEGGNTLVMAHSSSLLSASWHGHLTSSRFSLVPA